MTITVTPLLPGSPTAAASPAQPGGRPRDPAAPGAFARELEQAQAPLLPSSATTAGPAAKPASRKHAGTSGPEPARTTGAPTAAAAHPADGAVDDATTAAEPAPGDARQTAHLRRQIANRARPDPRLRHADGAEPSSGAVMAPDTAETASAGEQRRRLTAPTADAVAADTAQPAPMAPDPPAAQARPIEATGAGLSASSATGAPDGAGDDAGAAADPAPAGPDTLTPDSAFPGRLGAAPQALAGVSPRPVDDATAHVDPGWRGGGQLPPVERRSGPEPDDAEPRQRAAPVRAIGSAQVATPDRQAEDLVRAVSGASRELPTAAADASEAVQGGAHQGGPATPATAAATTLPFAAELARAGQGMSAPPAPAAAPAAAELHLPTPVHDPDFVPRLSGTLALLARDGVQEARVQVHPLELGPISVQITLDGANAQVHLAVDSTMTRELLEQAMPTLATALRENGLTLTGGGVFQQARQSPRDAADGGSGRAAPGARRGGADADPGLTAVPARRSHHLGVLDTYA